MGGEVVGVGCVPAEGKGEGGVSLRFLVGGESGRGGRRGYYSFVPSSLGSRWVGLGDVMFAVFWRFHGQDMSEKYLARDDIFGARDLNREDEARRFGIDVGAIPR